MVKKKAGSARVARKAAAKPSTQKKRVVRKAAVAETGMAATGSDPNRLLREAAWSRMFGRAESKNPFTR